MSCSPYARPAPGPGTSPPPPPSTASSLHLPLVSPISASSSPQDSDSDEDQDGPLVVVCVAVSPLKAQIVSQSSDEKGIIVQNIQTGVHVVNLGDKCFIVVRDGYTIFCFPIQQHDFNFTYHLESGNGRDLPSDAQTLCATEEPC